MKNFIKSLLVNRLGIVLATVNVCYLLYWYNNFQGFRAATAAFFLSLNLPAAILCLIFTRAFHLFFPTLSFRTIIQSEHFLLPFFIFFQWLLIVWLAKTLARKLRSDIL